MVVSDEFATLMVIVGSTRVKEVAFTLEIVGVAGAVGGEPPKSNCASVDVNPIIK